MSNSSCSQVSKIKHVLNGGALINPVLLNINNRPLVEDEIDSCECTWYKGTTDPSTRVINFTNSSKDDYQGKMRLRNNAYKSMLVLQNKKTNKIQLIEINKCQLSRVFQKANLRSDYDNEEMELTYEDNKAKLLKAFGSKKSNRVSEIGSRMRINSEIMMNQMKNTAADVDVDVRELEQYGKYADECVPPCHRDANTEDAVYLVEDFLSSQQLDSLEDESFTVLHLMPFTAQESGYSQLVVDALERMQNKVSVERIKVMLVVEALLRLFTAEFQPVWSLKARQELLQNICPFSKLVAKKLFYEYTVDSQRGRTRNRTFNDKIVIHMMALIIIACESVNTEELSRYLPNFSMTKISQIARTLCLSTRDKITWFVKLPLPPQKSFYMKKRK